MATTINHIRNEYHLPFTHEVIGYVEDEHGDIYICVRRDANEMHPFVTYYADSLGHCYHGHYIATREAAMLDLFRRAKITK